MSTLHTVNKSPFEKSSMEQCLQRAVDGSGLLLIEDAVAAAVANTAYAQRLGEESKRLNLYVLQPDLEARGFADAKLVEGITKVDYKGFVELTTKHDRVHSWL